MSISLQVMRVVESNESDVFKEIIGMDLIVVSAFNIIKFINAPLNLNDYDRYWKWVFKSHLEWESCGSDTFEEFKKEINDNSEEMKPNINSTTEAEFEYIRDLTEDEQIECSNEYEDYFNSSFDLSRCSENYEKHFDRED